MEEHGRTVLLECHGSSQLDTLSLTWHLTRGHKRKFVFQVPSHRCCVSGRKGSSLNFGSLDTRDPENRTHPTAYPCNSVPRSTKKAVKRYNARTSLCYNPCTKEDIPLFSYGGEQGFGSP